jgi:hypothetical protein
LSGIGIEGRLDLALAKHVAKDHQGSRKQLTPGERSAIAQDLQEARKLQRRPFDLGDRGAEPQRKAT